MIRKTSAMAGCAADGKKEKSNHPEALRRAKKYINFYHSDFIAQLLSSLTQHSTKSRLSSALLYRTRPRVAVVSALP